MLLAFIRRPDGIAIPVVPDRFGMLGCEPDVAPASVAESRLPGEDSNGPAAYPARDSDNGSLKDTHGWFTLP